MSRAHEPRPQSALTELGVPLALALACLVLLALAVQSTLLSYATILGVIPQLVLVVICCVAFIEGEHVGLVAGFFGGLFQDLQLADGSIVGLYALVFTVIGYGVGLLREYTTPDSVWTPVIAIGVASALAELAYALLAILLGQEWIGMALTAQIAGLVVLYNVLLSPLVFPLVKRVRDRYRPEHVRRLA
ncbi:MAG: rod shape-determining protein MreD [Actinomycetota bacterium]|nr:rod shape-determining protein MreD [Actinomycetota bacterium]